jgi:hypothetical protein
MNGVPVVSSSVKMPTVIVSPVYFARQYFVRESHWRHVLAEYPKLLTKVLTLSFKFIFTVQVPTRLQLSGCVCVGLLPQLTIKSAANIAKIILFMFPSFPI